MEYPKPLPFKKKPQKGIRPVSKKQAMNLRAYELAKRKKYEGQQVCSGCGATSGLTCSHLVARSHSFYMVANPANTECQCYRCHDLTERGQYFMLNNGLKLLERLYNGLGESGRQRFRYILNQWEQNKVLWEQSTFFEKEIQ